MDTIDCQSHTIVNAHCKDIDSILIVEDSLMLQTRIQEEISGQLNIKCDVASSEKEAKELLEKNSYSLFIVDIHLPDSDGDFVLYLIRKKLSIIVVTGSSNEEQRKLFVSLPIVDYLYKTDERSILNYLINRIKRLQKNKEAIVLLSDDSRLSRLQVTNLLKTQNLAYVEVENGKEAYDCVINQQSDIDLLITDINMPVMSGMELITKVRHDYDSLSMPILAYSAADKSSTIAQLIKTGANDFISKPINNEEFLTRLNNTLELSYLFKRNQELINKLNRAATTDFLTSLYNRNHFYQSIKHVQSQSKRTNKLYGVIMMDIDHFKNFNDNYGHEFGDTVLKEIANIIKNSSRDSDIPYRWGGEEFIVLVLNTSIGELARFAQRIRKNVEKAKIDSEDKVLSVNVTISCGVAIANASNIDNVDNTINLADQRLYTAKENGRNQVVYQ